MIHAGTYVCLLAAAFFEGCGSVGASGPAVLEPVDESSLEVTLGQVHGADAALEVEAPAMRAVVANSDSSAAELRFLYVGPTEAVAPLADGEIRRQIGLKLRAEDGCNLLYVMWRIEPKSGLSVQMKRNPGQHTDGECRDHGYQDLRPMMSRPVPAIVAGERHALRAEIHEQDLMVVVDGARVWQGLLPADAQTLDGPAGIRTDNGRFRFELVTSRLRRWWWFW